MFSKPARRYVILVQRYFKGEFQERNFQTGPNCIRGADMNAEIFSKLISLR